MDHGVSPGPRKTETRRGVVLLLCFFSPVFLEIYRSASLTQKRDQIPGVSRGAEDESIAGTVSRRDKLVGERLFRVSSLVPLFCRTPPNRKLDSTLCLDAFSYSHGGGQSASNGLRCSLRPSPPDWPLPNGESLFLCWDVEQDVFSLSCAFSFSS